MRGIALVGLVALFVIGGCPGLPAAPVVTVLTAGSYGGTLTCTGTRTDAAGTQPLESTLEATVEVTELGQLNVYGDDYVPGRTLTTTTGGVTITQTIESITEEEDTSSVSILTTGTIAGQGKAFDTTHDITITQADATHLEVRDIESSIDAGNDVSVQMECSGTLAR